MAMDLSAVGKRSEPRLFDYDWKDTALYALGIGARRDELDFLYEGRGPRVFPTFAVIPTMPVIFDCMQMVGGDMAMIVHGGQEVTLRRPLPPEARLSTAGVVRGVYDMKKLAQVVIGTESRDERGELLAETEWMIYVRGAGGFNGPPPPKKGDEAPIPRNKEPDFKVEEATSPEQALLYRLTGDLNPLHADPAVASAAGFADGPILHGLCSLGYMARALSRSGVDPARWRRLGVQFRRPVWPGDTLITEGFDLGEGKIALRTFASGRPDPVLTGGFAVVGPA